MDLNSKLRSFVTDDRKFSSKSLEVVRPVLEKLNDLELQELSKWIADEINSRRVRPVGIKVEGYSSKRPHDTCYCDVVLMMSDGSERPVKFVGCPDKVLYIYALMNRNGVNRYTISKDKDLRQLYSKMYGKPGEKLKGTQGHDLAQAVAQSRKAVNEAVGDEAMATDFVFDKEMSSKGNLLVIPFAKNNGKIEFVNF